MEMYICSHCGVGPSSPSYERAQVVHLNDGSYLCQQHAFSYAATLANEAKRICDEANAIVPAY
jgi:hypothetical protein